MLKHFKEWFSKSQDEAEIDIHLPKNANATFELKIDKVVIGKLHCEDGEWQFMYPRRIQETSQSIQSYCWLFEFG